MVLGERHGHRRHQRNALVGRAEQHVELNARLDNGVGVVAAQPGQRLAGVKGAGVKEVRADAP